MNRWDCDAPGCTATAVGVGGAIGLRAIGWHFEPGPVIRCPAHRSDTAPCKASPPDGPPVPCASCAGEQEARYWQDQIRAGVRP